MIKHLTLGKDEMLKSRKLIEKLFSEGKKFAVNPYKIYYLFIRDSFVLQFGFGVSGKLFKKAVDRNRIKRLTKEAYRVQKISLQKKLKEKKLQMIIFFIYSSKEIPDFNIVKEKVAEALKKIIAIVDENISSHS